MRNVQLKLEKLEDRLTPASAAFDGSGNLVVTGDNTNEYIVVNTVSASAVSVVVNGKPLPGSPFDMSANPGARVIVNALGGSDQVVIQGSRPTEVHGGDGRDFLFGGSGDDVLDGGAGDDYVYGQGGNDVAIGGTGKDVVDGGAGKDILVGGDVSASYDDVKAASDDWVANSDHNSAPVNDLVTATTDPDDAANKDTLTGGSQDDLFVTGGSGTNTDTLTEGPPAGGNKQRTV